MGQPRRFGSSYYSLFHDLLNVEECTVFSFADHAEPQPLLVEGRCESRTAKARAVAVDYISDGYRYDPNIRDYDDALAVYAIGVDDISDVNYRARFYETPDVTQELVVLGRSGQSLYYASFYRAGNADCFRGQDIAAIGSLAGFLVKALHRHNELYGVSQTQPKCPSVSVSDERAATYRHLREVLLNGSGKLSPREADVCAGIIMGYSTVAIGLNCDITPNTVATHRKRAYAKLGISSQNELFTRYFHTVRKFESRIS